MSLLSIKSVIPSLISLRRNFQDFSQFFLFLSPSYLQAYADYFSLI